VVTGFSDWRRADICADAAKASSVFAHDEGGELPAGGRVDQAGFPWDGIAAGGGCEAKGSKSNRIEIDAKFEGFEEATKLDWNT